MGNFQNYRQLENVCDKVTPFDMASQYSSFVGRHIGPQESDIAAMLKFLGLSSLDQLVDQTLPQSIRTSRKLNLGPGCDEAQALEDLRSIAGKNQIFRNYIGMGYSDCFTPSVILRNILENPGWYTQYTPYQAEISQGRLQALLNFQTMILGHQYYQPDEPADH